jgi:hypothetical protein
VLEHRLVVERGDDAERVVLAGERRFASHGGSAKIQADEGGDLLDGRTNTPRIARFHRGEGGHQAGAGVVGMGGEEVSAQATCQFGLLLAPEELRQAQLPFAVEGVDGDDAAHDALGLAVGRGHGEHGGGLGGEDGQVFLTRLFEPGGAHAPGEGLGFRVEPELEVAIEELSHGVAIVRGQVEVPAQGAGALGEVPAPDLFDAQAGAGVADHRRGIVLVPAQVPAQGVEHLGESPGVIRRHALLAGLGARTLGLVVAHGDEAGASEPQEDGGPADDEQTTDGLWLEAHFRMNPFKIIVTVLKMMTRSNQNDCFSTYSMS